ncbi:hypothetical protein [Actinokineospora sp.]|uniref:hypothetical protein n=1 Tax=Actinokineospora sp. TaxID=1872133 RepID=UPI0040376EE3
MSEPPYRRDVPPRGPRRPADQWDQGDQRNPMGGYPDPRGGPPRHQPQSPYESAPRYAPPPGYREQARQPAPRAQSPAQPPARQSAPARERDSASGLRLPGLGLLLAILGALVQVASLTVLPWLTATGGDTESLIGLWRRLSDGGATSFGDWYVLIGSYPLVILGILLSFAAVLESVAMKVVWAGLMFLGLGYLVLRYGLGPLTGAFGVDKGFDTTELVVAVAAVAVAVLMIFVLKTAVTMFRRVAALILLAFGGLHLSAVMDLADGAGVSLGAYGPAVGYLLTGVAALVGPRRLIPGG